MKYIQSLNISFVLIFISSKKLGDPFLRKWEEKMKEVESEKITGMANTLVFPVGGDQETQHKV